MKDGSDDVSISSQDEALCELLGIPSLSMVGSKDVVENPEHDLPSKHNATVLSGLHTDEELPKVKPLRLPPNVSRHFHVPNKCLAFLIPNLLTPEECCELISLGANAPTEDSNRSGFAYVTHATHKALDGTSYKVAIQKPNPHKLAVFANDTWVHQIWSRIQPCLFQNRSGELQVPDRDDDFSSISLQSFLERENVPPPSRLNPRLRVLRYDAVDKDNFAPHFDATTRIKGEISLLTVLIYLNSGDGNSFSGGETCFMDGSALSNNLSFTPTEESSVNQMTRICPSVGSVVVFEHDLFHSSRPLDSGTKYVLRTDIMFEISETQWEERALVSHSKSLKDFGVPDTGTDDAGLPTTVRALASRLGWSSEEIEGLAELSLADDSVDSFCAPGAFTLSMILRDVLPCIQQNLVVS
eukprot:Nitzschia sp. Nitz4//scaffold367_size14546//10439//11674//NITZ4_008927-RA/size14546-processed-gene-0.7-mRNA-1//1//CDS//3329549330//9077//frame0